MQKMRMLTINGPLESGKSWVAQQLVARHDNPKGAYGPRIVRVSIQAPLEAAARAICGEPTMPYDQFKKTEFFGMTGRSWMIRLSEHTAKPVDGMIFAKLLIKNMAARFIPKYHQIFVCDSNGFEEELDYWRTLEDVEVLAACIEPPDAPPPGQPYGVGDSRYNLSHKCGIVAANSTELLGKVEAAMRRRSWL